MLNWMIGRRNKMSHLMIKFDPVAQVVKLVDTRDLKSLEGNFVPVRVRPWAPNLVILKKLNSIYSTNY